MNKLSDGLDSDQPHFFSLSKLYKKKLNKRSLSFYRETAKSGRDSQDSFHKCEINICLLKTSPHMTCPQYTITLISSCDLSYSWKYRQSCCYRKGISTDRIQELNSAFGI